MLIQSQTSARKEQSMPLLSWLHKRLTGRPQTQRTPRRKPTLRLQLEALEDRCLPSTLTVLNNLNSGAGSLRAEIAAAKSGDTIVFDKSLKGKTITLSSSELYINKSLDIEGLGAANLAISGGNHFRVIEVAPHDAWSWNAPQVTLSGMTIENGSAYLGNVAWTANSLAQGGGILNFGTLTVSGCTVTGNHAELGGGGIANERGGTMTVAGSTVSNNSSALRLGSGHIGGGGIYNNGKMTLSDSSVIRNTGVGIFNDNSGGSAGPSQWAVLTMRNDVVNSNTPYNMLNFGTVLPRISSFTASPNPVANGSGVTLTASNFIDPSPGAAITKVTFYYQDSSGATHVLGNGTQTSTGVWTLTVRVNLAPGAHTLYALAEDSYGVFPLPAALSLSVQ
jgi:hypothetical protein